VLNTANVINAKMVATAKKMARNAVTLVNVLKSN
jgi:hypothetical protein